MSVSRVQRPPHCVLGLRTRRAPGIHNKHIYAFTRSVYIAAHHAEPLRFLTHLYVPIPMAGMRLPSLSKMCLASAIVRREEEEKCAAEKPCEPTASKHRPEERRVGKAWVS